MSRLSVRRRLLAVFGAAVLAVAGVVVPLTTSAHAAPGAGTYSVVNRGSNLCLDVLNFSTADNAGLIQYACAGTTNQRFTLTAQNGGYRITAGHSGKCLGVQDSSSSAGKAIVQQTCNGSASQTWTFSDASNGTRIVNGNGGKCVNTRDDSTASNAVIQQNSCDNVVTKHWTFTPSSGPQPTPTVTPTPNPTPTVTPTVGPPPGGLVGWATQGGGTTGGGNASATTVTSSGALTTAMSGTNAAVIRVSGTISCSGMLRVGSNKTIIGNSGAVIQGCGLNVAEATNVIIRNLTFRNWNDDAINVQYSTRVWIDHNTLSNGYDGAIDVKRASDYVTISWNRIYDHDKSMLLGHDDGNGSEDRGRLRVTYHHNWFDGTGQRHPRVRFGNPVHVYNNYYGGVTSYGVASTEGAGVLVEGNYFENTEDPYHLGEGDSGPGTLVARNNHFVNSGTGQAGGSVASIPYSYSLDTASSVKSIVTSGAGAGRINV